MRDGNYSASISEHAVRAALDSLIGILPALPQSNALRSLLLVDEILNRPDFPHMEHSRAFAVYHVLTSIITENLIHRRQILALTPPNDTMSLGDAQKDISRDAQSGSPDLIAWGLLYFCYVRVELNITLAEFARLINVVERSGRRYRKQAIQKLTRELAHREWEARMTHLRRRLLLQIPLLSPTPFLGRNDELKQIAALLSDAPAHILITGPSGIGKTSLICAAIRTLVESQHERIDEIIWINKPRSVAGIYRSIEAQIRASSSYDIKGHFLLYNVIIVIDDLNASVEQELSEIDDLLIFLSPCSVILVSDSSPVIKNIGARIVLKGLPIAAANQLVQLLSPVLQDKESIFSQEQTRELYDFVGGNPLGIKLGMQYYIRGDYDLVKADILHSLFGHAYHRLSPRLKDGLLAFVLCPSYGLSADELRRCWPEILTDEVIATLVRWHLVEVIRGEPQKYWISPSLSTWLKRLYLNELDTRERFAGVQRRLTENLSTESDFPHHILAHILTLDWGIVGQANLRDLILRLLPATFGGLDQVWMEILETYCTSVRYHSDDSRIFLAYGVSLRRCAQWKAAIPIFDQLIIDAGRRGNFIFQAQALLELSKVYSHRGDYDAALRIISQAQNIAARFPTVPLTTSIVLHAAQLAVDMLDGNRALNMISGLKKSRRRQFLLSEALLLTGKPVTSQRLGLRLLKFRQQDRRFQGRTHDLIARACIAQGKFDKAERHLLSAISYLESENDQFALARALSNLGTVYIHRELLYEALRVLRNAEQIQNVIGDKRGLGFTHHNLSIVRRSGLFS